MVFFSLYISARRRGARSQTIFHILDTPLRFFRLLRFATLEKTPSFCLIFNLICAEGKEKKQKKKISRDKKKASEEGAAVSY